jgi:Protein of unknown function (DUF4435)
MTAMAFEIDEVLNAAIMSGIPVLIVEGVDDVQTYDLIAQHPHTRVDVDVVAVETIVGYSGGSGQVIKAIQDLAALEQGTQPFDHYILGIVDRDVREFRNTLPSEPGILVLDGYSLETHFVTQEVLRKAILSYTKITASLIGEHTLGQLMANIENALLDLYYFALEALKCALNEGYDPVFSYSFHCNRRNDPALRASIESKRPELDQFASELGIVRDMHQLKKIAKGKWLLELFCSEIQGVLKALQNYCGVGDFGRCQQCRSGNSGTCMYKPKVNLDFKTIYELAKNDGTLPTLQYIRDRIYSLPAFTQMRLRQH